MFLFSAPWTRFELKIFDSALPGGGREKASDPSPEFLPLCGEAGYPAGKEAVEKMMRQAEEKAAHLAREAYDKGFAQGEKDGFELGRKKAEKLVSHMERLLEELGGLKQELAKVHEGEILTIVFAIAEKIVQDHALRDESLIRRTVFSALHRATDRSEISLRVNPNDMELIETVKPGFFAEFKELKHLSVTPDASITRGGCMLESPCGDVDGRIETQLDEIRQVLEETFRQQDAEERRE
jgi:flagellar assembly protein FliH